MGLVVVMDLRDLLRSSETFPGECLSESVRCGWSVSPRPARLRDVAGPLVVLPYRRPLPFVTALSPRFWRVVTTTLCWQGLSLQSLRGELGHLVNVQSVGHENKAFFDS